jgi:hypothetical protein
MIVPLVIVIVMGVGVARMIASLWRILDERR